MSSGFEEYKVDEIRAALVRNGFEEDVANSIKGKSSLVFELMKLADSLNVEPKELFSSAMSEDNNSDLADIDLTEVEMEDDSALKAPTEHDVEVGESAFAEPEYTSTLWSDFLMAQFDEDELPNGNPTVPAMRRLVNRFLGDILFSGAIETNHYYPSNPMEVGRASCVYEIKIAWKKDGSIWLTEDDVMTGKFPTRVFRGSAGSFLGNTDDDFAIYPEAIAETRAESRALRKALGLQNVVAHEEVTNKDARDSVESSLRQGKDPVADDEWHEDDSISSSQKLHIEAKCNMLGIDVDKFINLAFYENRAEEKAYNDINEIKRGTASHMIRELTRYQTDAGDESRKIPEAIRLASE